MFDLTENETRAAIELVRECLCGMGGSRPSDLDRDPYTWCSASTLVNAGWSRHAAAGTYGALIDKGVVDHDPRNPRDDAVTEAGYRFVDTIWDAA